MITETQTLPIGQRVSLPGHFDVRVILESARPLAKGFECRVRMPDGTLEEVVISVEEAAAISGTVLGPSAPQTGYRDPLTSVRRIEVKGRERGATIRLTTNEWYKAVQLGDSYWLYVVWDPLGNPDAEPLRIQNPAKRLEHAAKPVVSARCFDVPALAIEQAAGSLNREWPPTNELKEIGRAHV